MLPFIEVAAAAQSRRAGTQLPQAPVATVVGAGRRAPALALALLLAGYGRLSGKAPAQQARSRSAR